ncbi:MAG: hypothetical protein ABL958_13535, partial [Bdellovibrionia bacterium]
PQPTPAPVCEGGNQPAPYEAPAMQQFSDSHPGLIKDCTGKPVANEYLIQAVRFLQTKDCRWGFMKKSGGRIPRDILAYRSRGEGEGTNYFYVIDFVGSGCNNTPGTPDFNDPANGARPVWILTNPDGFADNGTWSYDP